MKYRIDVTVEVVANSLGEAWEAAAYYADSLGTAAGYVKVVEISEPEEVQE